MTSTVAEPREQLPHWDVSQIYSGLDADDYRQAYEQLTSGLTELEAWFDRSNIRRLDAAPAATEEMQLGAIRQTLSAVLGRVNELSRLNDTLSAYAYAFFSTDSYNTLAAREVSKLELVGVRRQQLDVRLSGWIGSLAGWLDSWISQDPQLAEHAYYLKRTARRSRYLMREDLEHLAAELAVDAGGAFGKLQGTVTSQLKVPFERDGRTELLPITVIRNFVSDPDAQLRERAYRAELEGWASIRSTVAACLNGVKGTALTLSRRRGWPSVLDLSVDDNRIDRQTLDAMRMAIREAFPMFRGYLQAKARKLGLEQLRWWDLFAPVGSSSRRFRWSEAETFLLEKFGSFSSDLADFARQAFDGGWIDAEPRSGKRAGAFCMEVEGVEQSRILMNFDGSFDQVSTLAHELGHGYHNHCQRGLPSLRRGSPMTLAETASIFCETLLAEQTLAESDPAEQLAILELQLCGATQVCLDISSRFQFETAVLERRPASELSADELCALMLDAQRETYADALDPATYHPYMWLWKPHYYSFAHNFYNFPYAFGHLFALGLYAIFRREGASFVPRYQALLRATGEEDAAPLVARFGIDIRQVDFWRASLHVIGEQARRYAALD